MPEVHDVTAAAARHPPWIGVLFERSRPRLMMLGESHHGPDPDASDLTRHVIEEWIAGATNPAYRFFTHLAIALSGQEPWQLDRREVFRPIAFYNYVLRVLPGSRVAPTTSEFAESEPVFRAIVETLRPTHIVVCGKRLWRNHMPPFDPLTSKGNGSRSGVPNSTLGDTGRPTRHQS
jgi:hypothetical protein